MDVLTVTEAARILQVTPALIRIYIQRGLFPGAEKVRGTRWKIPRAAVELFDGTNVAGVFGQKIRAPFCTVQTEGDKWCCVLPSNDAFGLFLFKEGAEDVASKINKAAEIWAKGTK